MYKREKKDSLNTLLVTSKLFYEIRSKFLFLFYLASVISVVLASAHIACADTYQSLLPTFPKCHFPNCHSTPSSLHLRKQTLLSSKIEPLQKKISTSQSPVATGFVSSVPLVYESRSSLGTLWNWSPRVQVSPVVGDPIFRYVRLGFSSLDISHTNVKLRHTPPFVTKWAYVGQIKVTGSRKVWWFSELTILRMHKVTM